MSQVLTLPKPRRNTELVLLFFALTIGIGASALVNINLGLGLDTDFYIQALILTSLALAVHIVLRLRAKYADPVILPIVVALNGVGLAMIDRLDIGTGDNAASRQWLWTTVAVAAAIAVIWFLRDHKILRRFTYISLAVSVLLLLLPLIPGITAGDINGARVWIRIGPSTFQPGEIAKITLAIFFAGYLSSHRELILLAGRKVGPLQLPRARDLGPMIVAWLASVGVLVFQRDIGSSVLFFGLFITMIYVATSRLSWVLIGLGLIGVGGIAAVRLFPHVWLRIDSWANAFSREAYDRAPGGSEQIVKGLFAMANGGIMGTGLGRGEPQLVYFANSDMIMAAIGEELGLVGITAVMMLYMLLVTRGFRAALGTRDAFGKMLACGLAFAIALQCFVVIGGVTRLIPLTGLTTPFLAAGGSSLLANWIIVALFLLISDAARRPISTVNPIPGAAGDHGIGASKNAPDLNPAQSQAQDPASTRPISDSSTQVVSNL
ncbi:FtsW/RodA/SpoVE family cell cycle protein [Acaricomes phytoseiuli]|uniref:FtsW/RodA/SpoVE family cell cycle protein n=1 Tax=Acaricomes phytoseiuli TaxID=291968 RepID=UPI00037448C3|nr:FtsW/RodA/SpoVE family cell cycle protein [Acaricomes phytoseiuli]MCW1248686.1 FtsW/RodA/SpoVE family cell cycle protein [Acaricomes phytoseiuli]